MVTVFINNVEISVNSKITVIQACGELGIEIPKFCYYSKLLVAGNCRMCLVEVEKSPKPVAACAFPVSNGLRIYTDTPLVKKARESVLEFLLINHPLDCPVCDQGGECDLQNQSINYGGDRSRFFEIRRSVSNKSLGVLVKSVITRCIHCTRCIRFTSEVGGVGVLGVVGRGSGIEISLFQKQKSLSYFLSGNVIDLCPVGYIKKY